MISFPPCAWDYSRFPQRVTTSHSLSFGGVFIIGSASAFAYALYLQKGCSRMFLFYYDKGLYSVSGIQHLNEQECGTLISHKMLPVCKLPSHYWLQLSALYIWTVSFQSQNSQRKSNLKYAELKVCMYVWNVSRYLQSPKSRSIEPISLMVKFSEDYLIFLLKLLCWAELYQPHITQPLEVFYHWKDVPPAATLEALQLAFMKTETIPENMQFSDSNLKFQESSCFSETPGFGVSEALFSLSCQFTENLESRKVTGLSWRRVDTIQYYSLPGDMPADLETLHKSPTIQIHAFGHDFLRKLMFPTLMILCDSDFVLTNMHWN